MKKPVVSIVGRPNVGKSTLFNRVIRRREAIVDDTPGITRDRKFADAAWEGLDFIVVDTGGYIPKGKDAIELGVARQVKTAIGEADLVVFLVDASTGITDVDDEMARVLRKSRKRVLVAVNKVDNAPQEMLTHEFQRLGLGDPIPVSAETGRGMGDFLSALVQRLEKPHEAPDEVDPEAMKLAVIGKPNVGKSTFINTIVGEERLLVTEIPGTTRDSVDVRFRYEGREVVLVDTAGIRRKSRITEPVEFYSVLRTRVAVNSCDVACLFVDASEGLTQQDMRAIAEVTKARKGILIAVNKWDLVENDIDKRKMLADSLEDKLHGLEFIPVLYVSCKTGTGVREVMVQALSVAGELHKRVPVGEINQLIAELNRQLLPAAVGGKRVRIVYGSQVRTFPPRFAFFCNYPELIQASYRKFLEKRIRERFGFFGVPLTLMFRKK